MVVPPDAVISLPVTSVFFCSFSGSRRRHHFTPLVSLVVSFLFFFPRRVPSDVLVDAVSLTYDVTVSSEDEEGPRRCEDLSPSQAFEVGMAVGEKVRRILDLYEKRWRHSLRDFHLETPTGSSVPESRRLPPLVFVKCRSVKLRISGHARPSSPLEVWWSSIASRATGRQSSTRGSLSVRFEKVPVQTRLGPKAYLELGTPIAPYITSLSAIGQAYALGLADANDVEVVMKRVSGRSKKPALPPIFIAKALIPSCVLPSYESLVIPRGGAVHVGKQLAGVVSSCFISCRHGAVTHMHTPRRFYVYTANHCVC